VSLDEFLRTLPRDGDGNFLISAHRKVAHDENVHDQQYEILPGDFSAGEGVLELATRLGIDTDHPILEIACGTGMLSIGLARTYGSERTLATDARAPRGERHRGDLQRGHGNVRQGAGAAQGSRFQGPPCGVLSNPARPPRNLSSSTSCRYSG
jgi:predicted RNA methylase